LNAQISFVLFEMCHFYLLVTFFSLADNRCSGIYPFPCGGMFCPLYIYLHEKLVFPLNVPSSLLIYVESAFPLCLKSVGLAKDYGIFCMQVVFDHDGKISNSASIFASIFSILFDP
jgi:hypothetical protein